MLHIAIKVALNDVSDEVLHRTIIKHETTLGGGHSCVPDHDFYIV